MRDRDIDDILKQLVDEQPDVDPALTDGISKSLGSNLQPAGSLPPSWMLAAALVLICATVAIAGALGLGPHGFRKMGALDRGTIFPVLGLLLYFAAALSVSEAIPGSRRLMPAWLLVPTACVALAAVFALLFHDYETERFVSQGVKCLAAGLGYAVPAGVGIWWLLRHGYAVDSKAAGLVRGTLAGLAGVTMLEIHCPNFEAPHLIVWHIAVLPISAALGAWAAQKLRR